MQNAETLDARARPPERLRALYKKFQKMSLNDINGDSDMIDFLDASQETLAEKFRVTGSIDPSLLQFTASESNVPSSANSKKDIVGSVHVFESLEMPGWALSISTSIDLTIQGFRFSLHLSRQLCNMT